GIEVLERTIAYDELADAEEMFSTANYSKVMPCIKLDERNLNAGPMFERARRLYMEFAAES
ncbi:MAG: branched chain amino acid aminotransferase, partial [Proteobacteria bacterium]|nr:branched chain amino acid aminotransferase [Pseudomonadota bacterium]